MPVVPFPTVDWAGLLRKTQPSLRPPRPSTLATNTLMDQEKGSYSEKDAAVVMHSLCDAMAYLLRGWSKVQPRT